MERGHITLLGNVIQNAEEKINGCIKYLGVAPESVFLKKHRITPDYHYGVKREFYIDLTFMPLKNVVLEGIAPLEGDENDYRAYLEKNGGSGIHHVNLDSNLYAFGDAAEKLGAKRLIWNENSGYVYFDTRDQLGLKTECGDLTKFTPDEIPEPKSWDTQARVTTLGVIVRDIEKKRAMYAELLGVPLKESDLLMGFRAREVQRGIERDVHLNVSHVPVGDITVELLEPLDEDSLFADFLKTQGEGVYYVGIDRDQSEFAAAMKEAGVEQAYAAVDQAFICFETSELLGFRTMTTRK